MTLDEQLDKLGSEYRIEMEKERQRYFLDVLLVITNLFKCTKLVNELNEEFPMIKFLEAFYTAGFYKGLNYGIDSVDKVVIDDSDIPIKYGKEMADEINQEILDGTFGQNDEDISDMILNYEYKSNDGYYDGYNTNYDIPDD